MQVIRLGIATAALVCGSAAMAEDLVYYSQSNTGEVLYYDKDTIRAESGGYISVWTLSDAKNARTVKYRTRRVLWYIRCSAMSSGSMAFADYDAQGSLIDSGSFDEPRPTPDVPGSTGYRLVLTICGK